MRSLELKVPPVAVTVAAGLGMVLAAWMAPSLAVLVPGRLAVAPALALAGLAISGAGVSSFRRARTTVNPLEPEAASSLVRSGIYAYTRNPMYLGFAAVLAGWAVFLSNLAAFAILPFFVLYLDRYQIVPEERALAALFGGDFTEYVSRVRRWL
jgi:protein-S-isoprenylcysteine O-methyltransferase Ste14